MANTFFGLTIGTSGLYGANLGINTTAHNITNAETEGYTRQVLNQRADNALKANGTYGMVGTGVAAYSITQIRDNYYDEKFRNNNTLSGYYDAQDYYMKSIENYFNEIQLEGFNSNYNLFCDSLQELSKDPNNLAVRTQANSYAQNFCDYINSLNESMEKLQDGANFEVLTMTEQINSYGVQIAGLTKQINTLEVTGMVANDLRDQRNVLIDGLSNLVDISVNEKLLGASESGTTEYTVMIGESVLVDTYNWNTLKVVPREEKINQSDIEGLYEVEWNNGQRFDALHSGGRMQAIFEVRDGNSEQYFNGTATAQKGKNTITVTDTSINTVDKLHIAESGTIVIGDREYTYNGFKAVKKDDGNGNEVLEYEFALNSNLVKDYTDADVRIGQSISNKGIVYYMSQLDEFTRTFAKKFNDLHTSGYDMNGNEGLDYFNSKNKVSGENYKFEYRTDELASNVAVSSLSGDYAIDETADDGNYASYYLMTAKGFSVTKEIYEDPQKIVTSSDKTAGVEKHDLVDKYLGLSDDKQMFLQGTPQSFLQALVAELGVDAAKSGNFSKNQTNILEAVKNQRLSVSGVDMDEEAMNLVRYQNSYNLAAKVISTMNELYDKLINYMGA